MMGTRYIINVGHEYFDEDCDAKGYPMKKWSSHGRSYESNKEPEVGDSWTFEEDGKMYRRTITAVHFNGCVYEDTESYDVEFSITEIKSNKKKKK